LAESEGRPVEYQGSTVNAMWRAFVRRGDLVRIRFLSSTPSPRQGLRLSMKGGVLEVGDQRLKEIVLWSDTAPGLVEFACKPPRNGSWMHVWNTWVDDNGATQAWIGSAGMVIEKRESGAILRCSDGKDGPNFDDLVVEVGLTAAPAR